VANDYLKGRTRPYVNPLKYLVIIAGVYAFLILYLKIYDASLETFSMPLADAPADATSTEAVRLQQQWLNFYRQILNFIPLILIPFFSITTRWFTRSRDLYYGEHLVINSFLFGQTFLIIVLLTPLAVIFPSLIGYFPFFAFIVYIAYMGYFFHGTYGYPPLKSFFKAFFSLLTGYLIFVLFMIVIMILLFVFIFIKNNPVL